MEIGVLLIALAAFWAGVSVGVVIAGLAAANKRAGGQMPNLAELLRTLTADLEAMAKARNLTAEDTAAMIASMAALGAGIEAHNQTAAEGCGCCGWYDDLNTGDCARHLADWAAEASPADIDTVLTAIRGRHYADLARILGG